MNSIVDCDRDERMSRALMAIEALTYQFSEGTLEDIKRATPEQLHEFCSEVYMIAHAGQGGCGNRHENWLKKIEVIEGFGKSRRLYDSQEEMVLSRQRDEDRIAKNQTGSAEVA